MCSAHYPLSGKYRFMNAWNTFRKNAYREFMSAIAVSFQRRRRDPVVEKLREGTKALIFYAQELMVVERGGGGRQ